MMICVLCVPQSHKISHDVNTGVIQMTVDHFSKASEATYTVQIHDGRAKNQSSLVLVRDGERGFNIQYVSTLSGLDSVSRRNRTNRIINKNHKLCPSGNPGKLKQTLKGFDRVQIVFEPKSDIHI